MSITTNPAISDKLSHVPLKLSSSEKEQLQAALEAFYRKKELPTDTLSEPLRKIFISCILQNPSQNSLSALELRIRNTQQQLDKITHAQTAPLRDASLSAPILQKLIRLSQGFKTADASDNRLIQETLALLSKPMRDRVYFHLYLLHTCQAKKTMMHYGQKAFNNQDGCTATHQERAQALLHVALEQLVTHFSAVGNHNSQELMNCFNALPNSVKGDVYFQVYQLNTHLKSKDPNLGRNIFHRWDHAQETNLLRGEAIHRHLLKRFQSNAGESMPSAATEELRKLSEAHNTLKMQFRTLRAKAGSASAHELELRKELASLKHLYETLFKQTKRLEETNVALAKRASQATDDLEASRKLVASTQSALLALRAEGKPTHLGPSEIDEKDSGKHVLAGDTASRLARQSKQLEALLEDRKGLAERIMILESTIAHVAAAFSVAPDELVELGALAEDVRTTFREKVAHLTGRERNLLRCNCALMHLKKIEMGDNQHLRVAFEEDFVPHELPDKYFAARVVNTHAKQISYQGQTHRINTLLCPTVADHTCAIMDRTGINTPHALKARAQAALQAVHAPGTILAQLEALDHEVLSFAGHSKTPERALGIHYANILEVLGEPASVKIERLKKREGELIAEASAINLELATPHRENRSDEYTRRQRAKADELNVAAARLGATITVLEKRHEIQLELCQAIEKATAEEDDQAPRVADLKVLLRRAILRENLFYNLIDGGGTLARNILQLEYHLDQLPVGIMRRSKDLRQALSLVEQLRPILRGMLDELHGAGVFAL